MNSTQAEQIAVLLNEQNKLDGEYHADRVLASEMRYLFETDQTTGAVTAAVEVKRVQWYQSEILHLSVSADLRGRGLGRKLIARTEELAKENRARILQCTIRADNQASCALFESMQFTHTATFNNVRTGNNVTVWQKELVPGVRPEQGLGGDSENRAEDSTVPGAPQG